MPAPMSFHELIHAAVARHEQLQIQYDHTLAQTVQLRKLLYGDGHDVTETFGLADEAGSVVQKRNSQVRFAEEGFEDMGNTHSFVQDWQQLAVVPKSFPSRISSAGGSAPGDLELPAEATCFPPSISTAAGIYGGLPKEDCRRGASLASGVMRIRTEVQMTRNRSGVRGFVLPAPPVHSDIVEDGYHSEKQEGARCSPLEDAGGIRKHASMSSMRSSATAATHASASTYASNATFGRRTMPVFLRSTSFASSMLNKSDDRWLHLVHLLQTLGRLRFRVKEAWLGGVDDNRDSDAGTRKSRYDFVNSASTGSDLKDVAIMRCNSDEPGLIDPVLSSWNMMHKKERFSTHVHRRLSDMGGLEVRRKLCEPFHPHSRWRHFWMLTGLLLIGVDILDISLDIFDKPKALVYDVSGWIIRIFWTIDICLCFCTGFYVKGKYEDRPRVIAITYLKTWFLLDSLAVVPDWIFFALSHSAEFSNISQSTRWPRALKVLRLIRLAKSSAIINGVLENVNSISLEVAFHTCKYMICILLWIHAIGCMFYVLANGQDSGGWLGKFSLRDSELPSNYFVSIQWAVSQLQGNTDISPVFNAQERGFAVLVQLSSIIILALFISKITNLLARLQAARENQAKDLRSLQEYMHRHGVGRRLAMEARKYIENRMNTQRNTMSDDDVLFKLSRSLRRRVLLAIRSPRLSSSPIFVAFRTHLPRFFGKLMCDILKSFHTEVDELVYMYGESCERLYIFQAGSLAYDHYSDILASLMTNLGTVGNAARPSDGGHFFQDADFRAYGSFASAPRVSIASCTGRFRLAKQTIVDEDQLICEAVMYTRWNYCGDLRSLAHCSFLVLDALAFTQEIETQPMVRALARDHAKLFVSTLNFTEISISDLLSSEQVLREVMAQPSVLHKATVRLSRFSDMEE